MTWNDTRQLSLTTGSELQYPPTHRPPQQLIVAPLRPNFHLGLRSQRHKNRPPIPQALLPVPHRRLFLSKHLSQRRHQHRSRLQTHRQQLLLLLLRHRSPQRLLRRRFRHQGQLSRPLSHQRQYPRRYRRHVQRKLLLRHLQHRSPFLV